MMSTLFSPSSSSRSSVHSDLPVEASVWRSVILLVSPRFVWEGWVEVVRVLWVVWRREVKRSTWARARAEERVPIRRVRGVVVGGFAVEVELEEGANEFADVWVAIAGI